MKRILAFDIGASSGRAMLAVYENEKIVYQEIHRFSNDAVKLKGTLYWDFLHLYSEIKTGINKASLAGGFDYIGIDTWGVDFGLIDNDGQLMSNPVHYRDNRTDNFTELFDEVDAGEIYNRTGIQVMNINTLFQLRYLVKSGCNHLENAKHLLFMPDLLNYFLTGIPSTEYTIASTSQMLSAEKRDWDYELIEKCGIPTHILTPIKHPGEVLGELTDEICQELGAPKAKVVLIGSHDTASAVVAVPTQKEDFLYLSCGTWSLMGTECAQPVINETTQKYNYTNEGGFQKRIRLLKNIMGLWILQECRRQWIREGSEYSYSELEQMAKGVKPFNSIINVDDDIFIKPGNMPERIREFCRHTGQRIPQTIGETVRCIYESLALAYRYRAETTSLCTGKEYGYLHMIGGGIKSELLCRLTADATGKTVIAGPIEATVLGNIAVALIASGQIGSLKEARAAVKNSSEIKYYEPVETYLWDEPYEKYRQIIKM